MSEDTTESTSETTEESPVAEEKVFDEAYVKGLRGEAAKHRSKVRELEATVASFGELESEYEALKTKYSDLEASNSRRNWADEITKDSPIPATVLRGDTKEEMESHFEELSALIKDAAASTQSTIPADTERPLPLNSTGLESAMRNALGI